MLLQKKAPQFQANPTDDFVRTLPDAELVDRCVQGFRKLRKLIPYLREARRRWAQPGRRVPVPGRPSWTEWITQNLHVTPRRVQQLLNEPSEIPSQGQKAPRRLSKGDWRALFKLTEKQMAKVFGPLESGERFAEAIQQFAQAWRIVSASGMVGLKYRLPSRIGARGTIARTLVAPLSRENLARS